MKLKPSIHHHTPLLCGKDVDDTFTVIKSAHERSFLDHINSIDQCIQFSSEYSRADGSMPFLDILATTKLDGSLSTTVYRKPTLTDLYLQWDSHHTISSKYSVAGTLHCRAKLYVLALSYCNMNRNMYTKFLQNASTQHGLSTELRSRPKLQPITTKEEAPSILETTPKTTRILTWWFLIPKGEMRASGECAVNTGTSVL